MPKIKVHSGASKRFKVTATGKIMRMRPGTRHLAPGKTQKQKRHLRKRAGVHQTDRRQVKKQLTGTF